MPTAVVDTFDDIEDAEEGGDELTIDKIGVFGDTDNENHLDRCFTKLVQILMAALANNEADPGGSILGRCCQPETGAGHGHHHKAQQELDLVIVEAL